jgi:hypothetical protein
MVGGATGEVTGGGGAVVVVAWVVVVVVVDGSCTSVVQELRNAANAGTMQMINVLFISWVYVALVVESLQVPISDVLRRFNSAESSSLIVSSKWSDSQRR